MPLIATRVVIDDDPAVLLLVGLGSGGPGRRGHIAASIRNVGAKTAYLGGENTVTSALGYPLDAGAEANLEGLGFHDELWAICAAADSTTLAVFELR